MKLDKTGLAILLIVVIGIAAFLLTPASLQTAPTFSAKSIDDEQIDTGKWINTPYLVVFWATDCPGCVAEIPHLLELREKFKGQPFEIVAVAMPHDKLSNIRTMREEKKMDYPIVFDSTGSIGRLFNGVQLTPTTFLISPEGKIVLQQLGELDFKDVEKKILAMNNA